MNKFVKVVFKLAEIGELLAVIYAAYSRITNNKIDMVIGFVIAIYLCVAQTKIRTKVMQNER